MEDTFMVDVFNVERRRVLPCAVEKTKELDNATGTPMVLTNIVFPVVIGKVSTSVYTLDADRLELYDNVLVTRVFP
jgi:hypothetical protein